MTQPLTFQPLKYFVAGSIVFILIAIGHTGAFLGGLISEQSIAEASLWEAMSAVRIISASRHSVYDFYLANNAIVGLLNLAIGAIGLNLARSYRARRLQMPRSFIVMYGAIAFAELTISILWNPLPPIIFLTAALACFVVAFYKTRHS